MSLSLIALFFWLFAANVAAMVPARDNHWRRAYGLMALGGPLLIWVAWENPWWVSLLAVGAAVSILRWPVVYSWRWIARKIGRKG